MKRLICLFMALALVLCACSKGGSDTVGWQEQYDLGLRYLSEGNYEEAILAFTAAIDIDPKQAPAFIGRAEAYLASGETSENLNHALADYKKATSLDKNSHAAYLGLGGVQLALNDAKGAQESYQKAIKLDKSSIPSYLGLSNAYAAAGDLDAALDALYDAVDAAGESAELTDKMVELEAQGAVGSGENGGNGSGEGSSNSGEGGNGPGGSYDIPASGSDVSSNTKYDIGLAELEISNLSSSFSYDYIEDTKTYIPNAAMNWDLSFDVSGPSNVHYLVHAGYGIHTYSTEVFQSVIDEAFWKENPQGLEQPSNYYISLLVMEDQLGKDIYCYYLGLDENMDPVAYTVITDTVPN